MSFVRCCLVRVFVSFPAEKRQCVPKSINQSIKQASNQSTHLILNHQTSIIRPSLTDSCPSIIIIIRQRLTPALPDLVLPRREEAVRARDEAQGHGIVLVREQGAVGFGFFSLGCMCVCGGGLVHGFESRVWVWVFWGGWGNRVDGFESRSVCVLFWWLKVRDRGAETHHPDSPGVDRPIDRSTREIPQQPPCRSVPSSLTGGIDPHARHTNNPRSLTGGSPRSRGPRS